MVLDVLFRRDCDAVMNEKSSANFVAAALIAPLVALCCFGPVVLGSLLGGVAGWLGGLSFFEVASATAGAAVAVYAFLRWRRTRVCRVEKQQTSTPPDRRTLR
jgi:hypothetical protein